MMDTPENVDMDFRWKTRKEKALRKKESEKTSKKS